MICKKDSNILISVIIPTFGNPTFLRKAIESVLRQTFIYFELIVVDDNNPNTKSRIETESIMKDYISDIRVIYIKHSRNMNGAAARNSGFAAAKGRYIALLDSDDEYMPDRLKRCFDEMERATNEYAGVYTGCEFRKGGKAYHFEKSVPSGNFLVETLACRFMFCTGSNIFVRKSVVDELNGFDPTFLRHQDYEFLVRVFQKYSIIGIPEILVVKNNENTNVPDAEKLANIKTHYLVKYNYLIKDLSEKEVSFIYRANYIEVAETAMAQKQFKLANNYYKLASQYGNLAISVWMRRLAFPIYNIIRR